MTDICAKCGAEAEGYKCDLCGVECSARDDAHECGSGHCTPRCSGCGEAEAKCTC